MFTARLRKRVASAIPVNIGELPGHLLRWHKRSSDRSSKCDAFPTGLDTDITWGVLFSIDESEKVLLDAAEGLGKGYDEHIVMIQTHVGIVQAYAYLATDIDENLRPYDWYKEYVLVGARQHALPVAYVNLLHRIEAQSDPDRLRSNRHWTFIRSAIEEDSGKSI